jgi:arabinofuranosyltransferase
MTTTTAGDDAVSLDGAAQVDAAGGPDATRGRRTAQLIQWAGVLVPVAVVVVMGWQRRWMSDDGFIHLRVVEQITAGHGAVFNVGERVEASTSPLWIAFLAVADLFGGPALPWKAVGIGIVLTGVGVLFAARADLVLTRTAGDRRFVLPVGACVVAVLPPFWDFATSGLETGMIFAWLGGSQWWCARRVSAGATTGWGAELAGAALVGLGTLIHPELALFTLVWGAVLLVAARSAGRRRMVASASAIVALPVAYQVFRMGYYGLLVPNTAVAKSAADAQWGQGLGYLLDLLLPYGLWLPVAVLVAVTIGRAVPDWSSGARLRAACRLAPLVGSVLQALYVVRVGGDFMHARLLLPAVFAALAPVGVPVSRRDLRRPAARTVARLAAAGAVAAWIVACAVALPRPGAVPWDPGSEIVDERLLQGVEVRLDLDGSTWDDPEAGDVHLFRRERLETIEATLRDGTPWSAAAVPVGGVSWASRWDLDVYEIELGSLTHPIGSHVDQRVGTRPGHQKPIPLVWQAVGLLPPGEDVRSGDLVLVSAADLRAAEQAVTCGQLGSYLDGIREPLTVGRFLDNLVNSVANTRLTVPVDPEEAAEALCGG